MQKAVFADFLLAWNQFRTNNNAVFLWDSSGCEVNLLTDKSNCGAVGNDCSNMAHVINPKCEMGVCKYDRCEKGYGDCKADVLGCESDLTTAESCGLCGNFCKDDKICGQDNDTCCYQDGTVYSHSLDACCNANASVWRECLDANCLGYQDRWQCAAGEPSGHWEKM